MRRLHVKFIKWLWKVHWLISFLPFPMISLVGKGAMCASKFEPCLAIEIHSMLLLLRLLVYSYNSVFHQIPGLKSTMWVQLLHLGLIICVRR